LLGRKKQVYRRDAKSAEKNYNLGKKMEGMYFTDFPGQKQMKQLRNFLPSKLADREGSR